MSRLIDADLLKRNITKWLKPLNPDETETIKLACVLESVVEEIDEQPTAFDVDKVVTQIKDIKDKEYAACTDQKCGYCRYLSTCSCGDKADKLALDRAIKIVKGGGTE
ncbi:hypothetical protein [Blautia intestinalis]|uniref:hypothetical protein n=1 Tax=Blautia intestinalis TaxID=2763028 RepID=UPI0022E7C396|nr:hypothetical protein [Blautia intestinalis]